eukprot:jgi/Mesvir1/24939/Mv16915-RA.1
MLLTLRTPLVHVTDCAVLSVHMVWSPVSSRTHFWRAQPAADAPAPGCGMPAHVPSPVHTKRPPARIIAAPATHKQPAPRRPGSQEAAAGEHPRKRATCRAPAEAATAPRCRVVDARGEEAQLHPVACASAAETYAACIALRASAGELAVFPPEVLHHMLRFLSPEDLTTCARVCKYLAHMTLDAALWRHLYCLRWSGKVGAAASSAKNSNWKKMYFELDRSEAADAITGAPPELREDMAQMQRAYRTQAPTRAQVAQDDSLLLHNTTMGEEIASWRARHGFVGVQAARRAAEHTACSGPGCSYHVIGDVFLCETTGRAHVCDDTCREMVVDPSNELMVCPVSGRTSEQWLGDGEGNAGGGYGSDKEAEEEGEGEEIAGGAGRLARAFWLGYYCKNEKELDSKLGRRAAPGVKN